MKKPELLAPAGSKESLIAAIENGADAIYFGGLNFSARHEAGLDDIQWAINYAHIRNVKAYVTINTIIKNSELEEFSKYLQFICNSGADAVIIQDFGILSLIREQNPMLPIHASTQMTIHNIEGVKFLKKLGIKRVVLARELSLEEIKKIKSVGIEIETFIHGALCFSYSGLCLLSSMIGGRSGNRGYCAQPCRKRYKLNEADGHLLSPKDLNMSEHIGDLIEANIDSFKIEGRLKRPEYVAGVVRIYRNLIDRYFENPLKFYISEDEKNTLLQLFNRGFTTGYYYGNPQNSLMSRTSYHNKGTYLGKVIRYDKKYVYIHVENPLRIGDGIGNQEGTGLIVRNMYIDNISVDKTPYSATVKIPTDKYFYKNESVYKTYDSKLMESLVTKETIKIPVKMRFKAKLGKEIELYITDGKNKIRVKGKNFIFKEGKKRKVRPLNIKTEKAKQNPTSEESVIKQLKKLGNSIFEAKEIKIDLDKNVFIPISHLNAIRREGIKKLEEEYLKKHKQNCKKLEFSLDIQKKQKKPLLSVNVSNIDGFEAAVENGADVVYLGNELKKEEYQYALEYAKDKDIEIYLGIPRIIKDFKQIPDFNGFLISDYGALNYFNQKPLILDYGFNIFNKFTVSKFMKYGKRVTLSPELNLDEIKEITPYGVCESIVHGYFPIMISEHDLIGSLFLDNNIYEAVLKDDKGFRFKVIKDKEKRTYIMNSKELCMLEYVPKLMDAGIDCMRIEAKLYGKKTIANLTKLYRKSIDKGIKNKCSRDYTTGHYFRGVL